MVFLGFVAALIALLVLRNQIRDLEDRERERNTRVAELRLQLDEEGRARAQLTARVYELERALEGTPAPVASDDSTAAAPAVTPAAPIESVSPDEPIESTEASDESEEPTPAAVEPPVAEPATPSHVPPAWAPAASEIAGPATETADSEATASERRLNLEQLLGVRGAAVLGGIVFGLAALLFVRYAIDQGLITPAMRIGFGLLAGGAGIVGSFALRRRGYAAADAVAGAGVVALYASLWAGWRVYGFWPAPAAFAGLAAVTAACGRLTWTTGSRVLGAIGLIGGFATPVLVSTGEDRPLILFGYLLALDAGMLALGRRTRAPLFGLLGLALTFCYQAHWVLTSMAGESIWIGLAVVAAFPALFGFLPVTWREGDSQAHEWVQIQVGSFIPPLLAAPFYVGSSSVAAGLYPVALLLVALALGAAALARVVDVPQLPVGTAGGSLVTVFVWLWLAERPTDAWFLEGVVCTLGLAALYHVFAERELAADVERPDIEAAPLLSLGAGLVFAAMAFQAEAPPFFPWLGACLTAVGIVARQAWLTRSGLLPASFGVLTFGLAGYAWAQMSWPPPPISAATFSATALALVVAALVGARRAPERLRRSAGGAALVLSGGLTAVWATTSPWAHLGESIFYLVSAALMVLTIIASAGSRLRPLVFFCAVAAAAFSQTVHAFEGLGDALLFRFVLSLAAVAICFFFVLDEETRRTSAAIRTAAVSGSWWFPAAAYVWDDVYGDAAIGLLPVLLAAWSGLYLSQAKRIGPGAASTGLLYRVWNAGALVSFLAVAIPMQLDDEWVTIGWALQGAALIALWTRLNHWGLKYYGFGLLMLSSMRLLLDPQAFSYHPRSGVAIFNWLLYAYLVPAAAVLVSARLLAPLEVKRRTSWEPTFGRPNTPVLAAVCGTIGLLIVFWWINLTIFDAFSTGREIQFSLEREATRDLVLSLAWGVYALALLAAGVVRKLQPLRWASLVVMLGTVVKVFLHDLGELEDLYRVASLVGLAASLTLISLGYQRFVFGTGKAAPESERGKT